MTAGLSLMKNELTPLAKNVLLPYWVAATTLAMQLFKKNILGSGMTTLLISNKEMDDTMKIVKSLEE